MYICLCHAVTDREMREAVRDGARNLQDLSFRTGCGTQCGSCVQQTRAILDSELAAIGATPSAVGLKVVSTA